MKNPIDLFAELGSRLSSFGCDAHSRQVIEQAHAENGWFAPDDIQRAVAELCRGMLRRDKLTAWLAHYELPAHEPKQVLVVMAGNIPLVGFFDLLCVIAAGHHCRIKPSTKDAVLIRYVVELMREIDPDVSVSFYDGSQTVEAVIATGSDNANCHFRTLYGDLPSLLRGNRHSVAVLGGNESDEQLRGLADDVFAYSGLGCRSVSLIFLPRGCELMLQQPEMNAKYKNNYRQAKALLEMTGTAYRDLGSALLVQADGFPTALSCVHFCYYDSIGEVDHWLGEHDQMLQCVVTTSLQHARSVNFGCAQSPALTDYPDACDVVDFLKKI